MSASNSEEIIEVRMMLIFAAAQSSSVPGDIPKNVAHHLQFATVAADHGAQLIVFPELSLTGYELRIARANVVRQDAPELDPLRRLAAEAQMTVVVGAPLLNDNDQLHIGALALRPDGSVSTYTKQHVHSSEEHVFTSGPGGPALLIEDTNVALAICADITHPQHAATAAARGANVYAAGVLISEKGYAADAELMRQYAVDHRMAVLMANYSGVSGGWVSGGKSAIWSEDGKIVAVSKGIEESLVIGRKSDGGWEGAVVAVAAKSGAQIGSR